MEILLPERFRNSHHNPITAMLGYSDMLLSTALTKEQRPLAAKIGQYVRRTKSLVASLISFARQAPAAKGPIDLNTLARTAVKLTQPQWEALEIEVRTQFDPRCPKFWGIPISCCMFACSSSRTVCTCSARAVKC